MLDVLSITGPIYLLLALGYVCGRRGVFSAQALLALGQFVVQFSLSAVLFSAISRRRIDEVFNSSYLLAYAAGSLLAWSTGLVIARLRGESLTSSSFFGLGMSVSNNGFMGQSLVGQLLGPPAAIGLTLCLMVENFLMVPLSLTLAEVGQQPPAHAVPIWRIVLHAFRRVLETPFVIAALAGIVVALTGLSVPMWLMRSVDLLAMSATSLSLLVIGGTLATQTGTVAVPRQVLELSLGKLLWHPLCVLLMLALLPPIDPLLQTAAVAYATMPMFSIYPLLAQRYGITGRPAGAVVMATSASFVTVSGWLWVLQHLLR